MSSVLQSMHNQRIPPLPPEKRHLVWLEMGEAIALPEGQSLMVFRERQINQDVSGLVLMLRLRGGNTMTARTPEDLNWFCSDIVVRCVEGNALGPLRVLLELGDMAAFPSLRELRA